MKVYATFKYASVRSKTNLKPGDTMLTLTILLTTCIVPESFEVLTGPINVTLSQDFLIGQFKVTPNCTSR